MIVLLSSLACGSFFIEHNLLTKILEEQSATRTQTRTQTIELLRSDSIYGIDWWEKPVVIEEYKLIFFPIPKVACTEFKLLLHRMMSLSFELPAKGQVHTIQNPKLNKLRTLSDYPMWKAQEMMSSPQYTKAVFVREPKERILSAFLNKFVKDKSFFRNKCCDELILIHKRDRDRCHLMINTANFE